jgi:hypothetical protein
MTFALLFRFLLIMALFLLISSINDIAKIYSTNTTRQLSLATAIVTIMGYITIGVLATVFSFTSYTVEENEYSKLGELFNGLKMNKMTKFFSAISIWMKFVLAILIISISEADSRIVVGIVMLFQIAILVYTCVFRPYSSVYSNVIEITIQVFFLILLILIMFINKESESSDVKSKAIMCIIAASLIIVCSIIICKFGPIIL